MKRVFAILLAAMMVVQLAACSTDTSSETPAETSSEAPAENASDDEAAAEAVELKSFCWTDPYVSEIQAEVIKAYEAENPGITIAMDSIASDGYEDQAKVIVAAQADYDIIATKGIAAYSEFGANGQYLDITEMIEADTDLDVSNYGTMWNSVGVDGKYFGLPFKFSNWQMFYNVDMFDEAGIDYPIDITWDEYVDIASQMKDFYANETGANGETIWGGYLVTWSSVFYAIQQGVYPTSDDITELTNTLELLNTVWTNGSHPSYELASSGTLDHTTEFVNGNVAMVPQGDWFIAGVQNMVEENGIELNWAIAPYPIPEGAEQGASTGNFAFISPMASTENPQAAYDFISYYCGAEGSEINASMGQMPAYTTDTSTDLYATTIGIDSATYFLDTNAQQEQLADVGYSQTLNLWKEYASLYFAGELTIEQVADEFIAERANILG